MTSTVSPPAPVEPDPSAPVEPGRPIAIYANLLPEEIIAGRRIGVLKHRMLRGLAALVALLVLAYGYSWWQTHSARGDITAEHGRAAAMQAKLRQFEPLITAQGKSLQIQSTLSKLMTDDLQWRDLLTSLRSSAPAGVTVESVSGTVTALSKPGAPTTTDSGLTVLNPSSDEAIGTLTISGTATDKSSVAAYVDALTRVKGLAAPLPASVTGTAGSKTSLTYSVNVLITTKALGGRFTRAATTGGK